MVFFFKSLLTSWLYEFAFKFDPFQNILLHIVTKKYYTIFIPELKALNITVQLKVHIFWEGHKILQNLPLTFDCVYCGQK